MYPGSSSLSLRDEGLEDAPGLRAEALRVEARVRVEDARPRAVPQEEIGVRQDARLQLRQRQSPQERVQRHGLTAGREAPLREDGHGVDCSLSVGIEPDGIAPRHRWIHEVRQSRARHAELQRVALRNNSVPGGPRRPERELRLSRRIWPPRYP